MSSSRRMVSRMRRALLPQPGSKPVRAQFVGDTVPGASWSWPRSWLSAWRSAMAQVRYIFHRVVQHQLLVAVFVHAQKVEQALIALAQVLEQLAGQVAVEKLHAASDGVGLVQFVELAGKRLEVHLQRPVAFRAAVHQAFLEGQELGHVDGLHVEGVQVDAHIHPARHALAQGEAQPGLLQRGFLTPVDQRRQGLLRSSAPASSAHSCSKVSCISLRNRKGRPMACKRCSRLGELVAMSAQPGFRALQRINASIHAAGSSHWFDEGAVEVPVLYRSTAHADHRGGECLGALQGQLQWPVAQQPKDGTLVKASPAPTVSTTVLPAPGRVAARLTVLRKCQLRRRRRG